MNAADILHTMAQVFSNFTALYLLCHIGDQVTQRFQDVGDAVYQLSWYTLPLDVQQHLPITISLTQKRIFVRGFADTRSTREVFRKVRENGAGRKEQRMFRENTDENFSFRFIFPFSDSVEQIHLFHVYSEFSVDERYIYVTMAAPLGQMNISLLEIRTNGLLEY